MNDYYTGRTKDGKEYKFTYVEQVDWDKCIGCGRCVEICGCEVFKMINTEKGCKSKIVSSKECLGEGHCLKLCPTGALQSTL